VRLCARRGVILEVQGLDAIDGSPLLDIKPYVPDFDSVANPTIPDWVAQLMQDYF
jgi:tRNA (adenine37-N6)-methyltransferase